VPPRFSLGLDPGLASLHWHSDGRDPERPSPEGEGRSIKEEMRFAMKLFDVVMLREDLPTEGLRKGQTGAIVEVFEGAFEVEFCDDEGQTLAEVALKPEQIDLVRES